MDEDRLAKTGAERALALFDRLDNVVCFLGDAPEAAVPAEIQTLVQDRQAARRAKDFAKADTIRKQLTDLGWVLEDSPDGPRVRRA
jgi:cysteinyl-tRNA synthetase